MAMSEDSKYVVDTGAGYEATYRVSSRKVSLNLASMPVDWAAGDTIAVVLAEEGLVLRPAPHSHALLTNEVSASRQAQTSQSTQPRLTLAAGALDYLDVDEGQDVRVYDHANGLLIVAAGDDPRVATDGGRQELPIVEGERAVAETLSGDTMAVVVTTICETRVDEYELPLEDEPTVYEYWGRRIDPTERVVRARSYVETDAGGIELRGQTYSFPESAVTAAEDGDTDA
jgi:hypothetical protein